MVKKEKNYENGIKTGNGQIFPTKEIPLLYLIFLFVILTSLE